MKQKEKKFLNSPTTIVAFLFSLMVVFFIISPGSAQDLGSTINEGLNYGTITGFGRLDLRVIIFRIIQVLFGFLGILAIIYIMYGGFIWMTSGGNPEKIERAKRILVNTAIGLFIILAAFAIVSFILRSLLSGILPGGSGGPRPPRFLPPCVNCGALGGGIIESVYPEPGSRDVPRNTAILVTFKELMQTDTIIEAGVVPPDNDDGFKLGIDDNLDDNSSEENLLFFQHPETDETVFLESSGVRAFESGRVYTFRPVSYLGDGQHHITYCVRLGTDIGTSARPNDTPRGLDYTWCFEIGTRLDLDPPNVENVFPHPDSQEDNYSAGSTARFARGSFTVDSAPQTPRNASRSAVIGPASVSGTYTGDEDVRICIVSPDGVNLNVAAYSGGCAVAGTEVFVGCLISSPRASQLVNIGCGLTMDFDADGPGPGEDFNFTVQRQIVEDTLRVSSAQYAFKNSDNEDVIGVNDIDIIGIVGDFSEIADRIATKITSQTQSPNVTATSDDDIVDIAASVLGTAGNSIRVSASGEWMSDSDDNTAFSLDGGENTSTTRTCRPGSGNCDIARNAIIRIDFNEAMFPPTIAGVIETQADGVAAGMGSLTSDDFPYIKVFADINGINGFEANEHVAGRFFISNIFKTVEFQPVTQCGQCSNTGAACAISGECGGGTCDSVKNSCGDRIFCLPVQGNATEFRVELDAAQLTICGDDSNCLDPNYNQCLSFEGRNVCQNTAFSPPRNFPEGVISPAIDSGVMDVAINSLDGDNDNNPEGPSTPGHAFGTAQKDDGDTLVWNFWIANEINLTPPHVEVFSPDYDEVVPLRTLPEARFDSLLMSSSLRPDNHYRDGLCGCNSNSDCRVDDGEICDTDASPESSVGGVCRRTDGSADLCLVDSECGDFQCYNKRYVTLIENGNPQILSVGYAIGNQGVDTPPFDGFSDKTNVQLRHTTAFPTNTNYSVDLGSGIKDIYQNCFLPGAGPIRDPGGIPDQLDRPLCAVSVERPYCCDGDVQADPCTPDLEEIDS